MFQAYFAFIASNWRGLLFGAALMGLSSFGQTYYVALFGQHFRAAFDLSDGGLGALYAFGTVASALTLTWVGRLLDRTTVRTYSWMTAALLSIACLAVAAAPGALFLAAGFYLLRLGGQGLMVHTALTATARAFPAESGRALGIVALGFTLAQAVFPALAVALIAAFGWRGAWALSAGLVLAGMALATRFLPPRPAEVADLAERTAALAQAKSAPLWRDRRLHVTMPAILAAPFFGTGFFFHQARLVTEKGWTLEWLAGWFAAFAAVQAITYVGIGPVIDRLGPRRLLPVFLAPFALGLFALAVSDSPWVAPVYLVLSGVSSAIAGTLATALWVQLYGPERLAGVRSTVEAALVIASGASPILMGVLIDRGIPLSAQAGGAILYMLAASLLAARIPGAKREG
ncbi:MAG: MFS transporter [Phenylobacterium sp.]|uniref:MFS transporter n=1 Tax=Phenylobacterium sp. TaxID=1871053 RepID=UPI00391D29B8